MSIQIYNTLTRRKEPFKPIEEGKVKMYVCGPTVYNYIHIGNARPPIVFDTVRRYLQYRGFEVQFISNFTDVDDKIIKTANENGEDVFQLAERFIKAYHEDVSALNVNRADLHPRVTDTMEDIILFIKTLIEKGYAYVSGGDVYFRTRKFSRYGKLSHQSIDQLRVGARIQVDEHKDDPLDFVLWKAAKEGEIFWESPWGKGRPGWHIECSAMVKKYLGETIDIHAGGQDLSFPHHENELAQSEALTEKTMARYWMHNGYININNEKMSKSLGNFILLHDLLKKYDPQAFRFFMLNVHYRHPINFTDKLLDSSKTSLERIRTTVQNLEHRAEYTADLDLEDENWGRKIERFKERFITEMDDDFNTSNAIAVLFDLTKEANRYLQGKNTTDHILKRFIALFEEIGGVLGLELRLKKQLLDNEVDRLIEERNQARKKKDFQLADQIRDNLQAKGIILEDTPQGVRWRRES